MADYSLAKNVLIIVLLMIIILSILGISLQFVFGNIVSYIFNFILSIIYKFFSFFGITFGYMINTTSDIASDTVKFGIDVTDGAVHDVGNLFLKAGGDKNSISPAMKYTPNTTPNTYYVPSPITAAINNNNLNNAVNNPSKSTFVNMFENDNSFSKIQNSNIYHHMPKNFI